MHLYALDLSLNRIYSGVWEDPAKHKRFTAACEAAASWRALPAGVKNIPTLQDLQRRKVAPGTGSQFLRQCLDQWLGEECSAVHMEIIWVSEWRAICMLNIMKTVMGGCCSERW